MARDDFSLAAHSLCISCVGLGSSIQHDAPLRRQTLNKSAAVVVLGGRRHMFKHQRNVAIQVRNLFKVCAVVDLTASGGHLFEVNVVLDDPLQVFAVAGNNPWPQLLEAFTNESRVLIESPRRVDPVAHIEMNRKPRPVHCLDQIEIGHPVRRGDSIPSSQP